MLFMMLMMLMMLMVLMMFFVFMVISLLLSLMSLLCVHFVALLGFDQNLLRKRMFLILLLYCPCFLMSFTHILDLLFDRLMLLFLWLIALNFHLLALPMLCLFLNLIRP